ncbi:tetratricopeptide repeat protein [Aquibacillus sp. 3ASR75-11]|uniref:Tetratricopeptide repeat protein n=1 Tax=Terrihalobacillus insolitus TaxID=2950438 RepID=A0A9X3WU13_9BACI|nr:tetratricopeptide repeat protein [Terrihalobacillus insolitus]MDC3412497.1 tetratricopeptide repeat protein [Terrihalobacillus insolitus]MDC3423916.1 tetratricopeptide repeat protein [Terrihalobacillus insolitus]
MQQNNNNIVIFPGLKKSLKEESLLALKEKRYEDALRKLDLLLSYDVKTSEILTGKIICLMELGNYSEAENLCQELLLHKDQHYFEYLHIYFTLLFQTSQYEELSDKLEETFKNEQIPEPVRGQFWQLYEITNNLKHEQQAEKTTVYIQELLDAIEANKPKEQWRLVTKCRKLEVLPPVEKLKVLLIEKDVHPVVKTAILQWFVEKEVSENIKIEKLNRQKIVKPIQLTDLSNHNTVKQLFFLLSNVEQKNPTLFDLMQQLLNRYLYVLYPFTPEDEHLPIVAQALNQLGSMYLHMETTPIVRSQLDSQKVKVYMEEIVALEKEYFLILED